MASDLPDTHPQPDLDRLAQQLAELGAETQTERQVKRILPWFVSLALHLGIAVLTLLVTWTVAERQKKDSSVLIVADFNALSYEPVVTTETQPQAANEPASSQSPLQMLPLEPLPLDELLGEDINPIESIIGAVSAGSPSLDQFAPQPSRVGASFAGVSNSNARKIVYLIDASGSMVAHLPTVRRELTRSLQMLSSQQKFSVIFFQNEPIEFPPARELKRATADELLRYERWADREIAAQGGTKPIAALEAALKLDPDVIFLLSQDITGYGEFEVDQRDLLNRLEALNPVDPATGRRRVQIQCIQFLKEDPLGTMRKIAEAHGGRNGYKFLSSAELGLTGR